MTSQQREATLDAADESLEVNVRGMGGFAFQLAGTFTGTVSFEGTVNGRNWVAINVFPPNSTTAATTATAVGVFMGHCAGLEAVRARFSTATSGAVQASAIACEAAGRF